MPLDIFTEISEASVAAGQPLDSLLMNAYRRNDLHLRDWLGGSYVAALDHNHDGVNSAPVTIVNQSFRDRGDGSDGSVVHGSSTTIEPGLYDYVNFSISAGVTLTLNNPGALIIRCKDTFTLPATAIIEASGMGGPAVSQSSGVPGTDGIYDYLSLLPHGGSAGGAGASNDGADKSGGKGGRSIGTDGGVGAPNTANAAGSPGATPADNLIRAMLMANPFVILGGASGGTSGFVTGTSTSGAGGGVVIVIAKIINFEGTINANGTDGTNGTLSAEGGAGGGGGGVIIMAAETYSNDTGTRNINKGNGGASHTQVGAGADGADGWAKTLSIAA